MCDQQKGKCEAEWFVQTKTGRQYKKVTDEVTPMREMSMKEFEFYFTRASVVM